MKSTSHTLQADDLELGEEYLFTFKTGYKTIGIYKGTIKSRSQSMTFRIDKPSGNASRLITLSLLSGIYPISCGGK